MGPCGGIGIHKGLKIPREQSYAGSSPATGMKSNLNFEAWKENVERWKAKYGVQPIRSFSITSIVVVKRCAKCNSVRVKMHRHHKGHEYLFACIMEERYAQRYIQFHPDDVDWLCVRCHKRAHTIYQRILVHLWAYLERCELNSQIPTYDQLEIYRKMIVTTYNKWVTYKKKRRKRRRSHAKRTT